MKKAIKLIAAFAAFVFAFAAEAATQKVGDYTWTYEVTDGKATICRRNSNNQPVVAVSPNPTGDVTIPSTLGGYPVTTIGAYALQDCDGMTMVTVPNGVEEIEYSAFAYCDGLATIELPVSVSNVSSSAFAVCRDLSAVIVAGSNPYYKTDRGHLLTKDGKTLVVGIGNLWHEGLIPDTVTDIMERAFYGRTHMTSVTIPDTVKTIGQDAFYDCTGLTSVSVPDSVNEIGADAFRVCENLKQIFLPGHLEGKLDRTLVFGNNTSLEILYRDTPEYSVVDGKLIRVMNPGNATRAVVPDGVTRIEQYAFSQAGANLDGLTHVTIPSSVAYIDPEAFLGCGNIIGFEVASDNPYYMAFGNLGFLLSKDYETLVRGVKGEKGVVTIPAIVKTIGKAAFSGIDGLLNAEIASGVTTIGEGAFSGCSSLTVATLPSSVKTIGASAFYGCTFLQSVTMTNGVTTIGASAFRGCSSLQSVKIPDSVTTIGASAFRDCSSLKSAELPLSLRNNIASTVFSGCAENFKAKYRCKVTFNGNGGTSSSAILFYGERIGTALPATNRSGYLFLGWYTAKEGGTQVTELTTVSGNAMYYAHWESQPVVVVTDPVTFVYNGPVVRNYGEPDKTSDTYFIPHGNSLGALPEPPAWSGHTFLGWYTAKDGGTKVTAETVVDGETYYYAHWKEDGGAYTVRYRKYDGSGETAEEDFACGKTYTLAWMDSQLGWMRPGYEFVGWVPWNPDTKPRLCKYVNGQPVKDLAKAGETIDLWAGWKSSSSYRVCFHRCAGPDDLEKMNQVILRNKEDNLAWMDSMIGWKREGYTFLGWDESDKATTVKHANGAKVKNLAMNGGTKHLYAVWRAKDDHKYPYTVKYYKYDGSGATRTQSFKAGTVQSLLWMDSQLGWSRPGYEFIGWVPWNPDTKPRLCKYANGQKVVDLASKSGEVVNLYPAWKSSSSYRVCFNRNDGTGVKMNQVILRNKEDTLAWMDSMIGWKREGYVFKGWAESASGAVKYANGAKVKNLAMNGGTKHLYAIWRLAD